MQWVGLVWERLQVRVMGQPVQGGEFSIYFTLLFVLYGQSSRIPSLLHSIPYLLSVLCLQHALPSYPCTISGQSKHVSISFMIVTISLISPLPLLAGARVVLDPLYRHGIVSGGDS